MTQTRRDYAKKSGYATEEAAYSAAFNRSTARDELWEPVQDASGRWQIERMG